MTDKKTENGGGDKKEESPAGAQNDTPPLGGNQNAPTVTQPSGGAHSVSSGPPPNTRAGDLGVDPNVTARVPIMNTSTITTTTHAGTYGSLINDSMWNESTVYNPHRPVSSSSVTPSLGAIPRAGVTYRRPLTSTRLEQTLPLYMDSYLPPPPLPPQMLNHGNPTDRVLDQTLGRLPDDYKWKPDTFTGEKGEDVNAMIRIFTRVMDTIVNKKDYRREPQYAEVPKSPSTSFGELPLDLDEDTADGILGKQFATTISRPDVNPLTQALLKQQQIQRALNEISGTGRPDVERLLKDQLNQVDLVSAMASWETQLMRKSASLQAHAAVEGQEDVEFIKTPILGHDKIVSVQDLKLLGTICHNKPFNGTDNSTRSGAFYLRNCANIINGKYESMPAMEICSYVFAGEFLAYIQNCMKINRDFNSFWLCLNQIIKGLKKSQASDCARKLEALLQKPPVTTLSMTLLSINNLLSKKISSQDYSQDEKEKLFDLELRRICFYYVTKWFLPYATECKSRFRKIIDQPGVSKEHFDTFGVIFAIFNDVIGDGPSSKHPSMIQTAFQHDVTLSEENIQTNSADVNAMGGFPRNNAPRGQNQAQGQRYTVAPHLRGKCLLCGQNSNGPGGHRADSCPMYSDHRISSEVCSTCRCQHWPGLCRNLRPNTHAVDAATNETGEAPGEEQ